MVFSQRTIWKLTGFIICSGQTKNNHTQKTSLIIDQNTGERTGRRETISAGLPVPSQENFAAQI